MNTAGLVGRLVTNSLRDRAYAGIPPSGARPIFFHQTIPGYGPTPVVEMAELARRCEVARIAVKNEQDRLGLPSFKALGSSWALHQRLKRLNGLPSDVLIRFTELRKLAAGFGPPTLCTASDGNHGRAVAALAEALGCRCIVFLPADTAVSRIDAIKGHGATVELIDGSYDDSVAAARATSRAQGHWYCPDTVNIDAAEDERTFASDVMAGYGTLFEEFFGQLGAAPEFLFVQAGVGGLSAAGVSAVRQLSTVTTIVVVEPQGSDAIARSFAAGSPIEVADVPTVMACLRCQSVSAVAWPVLLAGVDEVIVVTDEEASAAVRELARGDIVAGASGAAGLAGVLVACADGAIRSRLGLGQESTIAVVNTEGATDPESYDAIVAGMR